MSQGFDAIAEEARSLIAEDLALEAEQDPDAEPEAEATEPESTEEETEFVLDPEIPEDVQALLDEPEEEEDEQIPLFDENEEEYEYDEEKASLKKQLRAAEKKNAWLEGKRIDEQRVKWVAEAERLFPFSDPESITANSRRGFIKEAKTQHERNREVFARTGQKAADAVLVAAKQEAEQIKLKAKEEAEKAWGTASVQLTPQTPDAPSAESERASFERGGLAAVLKRSLAS